MPKKPKVHTVDSILDELRKEMKKGLGGKTLSKKASAYWEREHRRAVKRRVGSGKANWDKDKKKALPTARKLGRVAATLTTQGPVEWWAADAAHDAVKRDPKCPSRPGSGGYCDF